MFSKIANNFGGIIDIDKRTLIMDNLFQARIKFRGVVEGFLSNFMDVRIGEDSFIVRVWPLSKWGGQ